MRLLWDPLSQPGRHGGRYPLNVVSIYLRHIKERNSSYPEGRINLPSRIWVLFNNGNGEISFAGDGAVSTVTMQKLYRTAKELDKGLFMIMLFSFQSFICSGKCNANRSVGQAHIAYRIQLVGLCFGSRPPAVCRGRAICLDCTTVRCQSRCFDSDARLGCL